MTSLASRAALRLKPVAGWIGGSIGWVMSDQIGSDLAQANCTLADVPLMLAIAGCGALLAILGGLVSLRHYRASSAPTDQPFAGAGRFLALVSAMAAGVFLGAIIFQAASSLIIPQCHA